MICPKHHIEMPLAPVQPREGVLRRCPVCAAIFRAAVDKAKSGPPQFVRNRIVKQRVLPPVIMSERWP